MKVFAKNKEEHLKQKDDKIAHKIRLKKRLEKARSKISPIHNEVPLLQVDETNKNHRHQFTKPDPSKKALVRGDSVIFQKEQKEFERQIKETQYRRKISESKRRRKQEKSLLYKKTSKGQPVLSHQINHLLSKIQK